MATEIKQRVPKTQKVVMDTVMANLLVKKRELQDQLTLLTRRAEDTAKEIANLEMDEAELTAISTSLPE